MKVTYVIYSNQNKAVKIGYASDLASRTSCIQLSTPEELSLLFAFQGGRETEKELHQLLAKYRIRGEWFDFTSEVFQMLLDYQKQTVIQKTRTVEGKEIDLQNLVIGVAESFTKLFTISEIKKQLPRLYLNTKQVEKILLDYGWIIKTHNNSRVKYFYRDH